METIEEELEGVQRSAIVERERTSKRPTQVYGASDTDSIDSTKVAVKQARVSRTQSRTEQPTSRMVRRT